MLELARRGYISYGGFIPEVVLECSEMVKGLHYEFAHCGTDVIEAFQVCLIIIYAASCCEKVIVRGCHVRKHVEISQHLIGYLLFHE